MPTNQTAIQLQNSALRAESRALRAEVRRLQKRNAKLEVESLSLRERISALEKLKGESVDKPVDKEDLMRRIVFLLNDGDYEFVDGKIVKVSESVAARKSRHKS